MNLIHEILVYMEFSNTVWLPPRDFTGELYFLVGKTVSNIPH